MTGACLIRISSQWIASDPPQGSNALFLSAPTEEKELAKEAVRQRLVSISWQVRPPGFIRKY